MNISSNYYIRSLQWYRDGNPVPVNSSSDMRVYSDSMGTRLTIQRAGRSDEGEYTVKIHTVYGVDNRNECHRGLMSLMEGYYAAHTPVTFTISSSSSQGDAFIANKFISCSCSLICPDHPEQPLFDARIYVNHATSITIEENVLNISHLQFQSCMCSSYPVPQRSLYFNGYKISDSRVAHTIQSETIVLSISNATSKDFGMYEVVTSFGGGIPVFSLCLPYYFVYLFRHYGHLYHVKTFTIVKYGM